MSLAAETLPCSSCRAPVDPLRAPRVAHFDEHFCYFCSPACEEKYRRLEPERSQARPKIARTPASPAASSADAPLPSFDDPRWEQSVSADPDELTPLAEPPTLGDDAALANSAEAEAPHDSAHPD